jgi:hypothetical protein
MSKTTHFFYILAMTLVVIATTVYLSILGFDYYTTPLNERFYMEGHERLGPTGFVGHGLGVAGTVFMLIGVFVYILRKYNRSFAKHIRLKYLLEFHIFLCTLGPVLIVFHTAFKIGGLVSVAFWCMLAIMVSGVIGRFIYVQIPKTIEGRSLSLKEAEKLQQALNHQLSQDELLSNDLSSFSIELKRNRSWHRRMLILRKIKAHMVRMGVGAMRRRAFIDVLRQEAALAAKINNLELMNRLFKYWHVVHQPFTLVLLIIVVLHIAVAFTFGYSWIF